MIDVSVLHTSFSFSENFPLLIMLGQLSWHSLRVGISAAFITGLHRVTVIRLERKHFNKSSLETSLDLKLFLLQDQKC